MGRRRSPTTVAGRFATTRDNPGRGIMAEDVPASVGQGGLLEGPADRGSGHLRGLHSTVRVAEDELRPIVSVRRDHGPGIVAEWDAPREARLRCTDDPVHGFLSDVDLAELEVDVLPTQ